jgi:hypothetical protein
MRKFVWTLLIAPSLSFAFSFEDIRTNIETKNLKTIPEVLNSLPADFRSNYNLIQSSLSLQGTAKGLPRAILHTLDHKFILTFNAGGELRGSNTLEMIQFREDSREFEFRQIDFKDGNVVFSDANPPRCLGCHGKSPRPFLGESGDGWDESFGSTTDFILSPDGKSEFAEFLKLQPSHERYQYLVRKKLSRNYPFSDYTSDSNKFGDLSVRPTFRMSIFLSRLNALRISKYVFESPFYKAYPYTSMHWLNCFSGGKELVDLENNLLLPFFEAQFSKEKYPYLYREMTQVSQGGSKGIGLDLFLMEKLLSGADVRTWNLHRLKNHHENNWIWFSGIENQDEWIRQLVFNEFTKTHPEFASFNQQISLQKLRGEEFYRKVFRAKEYADAFDSLGPIYDRAAAQFACDNLKLLSLAEISGK